MEPTCEEAVYEQPVEPAVIVTQTTFRKKSCMRQAIPAFPMGLAIILAVTNFSLPGCGTILAGFAVLCCGNTGQSRCKRVGTCFINIFVGVLQLLTSWLIIGWVWSIIWGVAFIASAAEEAKTITLTSIIDPTQAQPTSVQHHTHTLPDNV